MTNRLDFPLNVKRLEDGGEFEGYASVFDEQDRSGDIIEGGAFEKSLAHWKQIKSLPPLLWQHNHEEPIGVFKAIEEDAHGLRVKGQLLIDEDPNAKRIYAHLKAGSIKGLSVGFILKDYERSKEGYNIKEADLVEISLVTVPANRSARIINVKEYLQQGELPPPADIEKILRDAGFSRKQAKAFMAGGAKNLLLRDADSESEALTKALSYFKSLNTSFA